MPNDPGSRPDGIRCPPWCRGSRRVTGSRTRSRANPTRSRAPSGDAHEAGVEKLSSALGDIVNYNGGREPTIPPELSPAITKLVQIHADLERVVESIEMEN